MPRSKEYTKSQEARDWRFIWATPEGHRALASLLSGCGLFKPILGADPQITAFNEGRRNVALDIVQFLSLKPEQFADIASAMQELMDDD